MKRLFLLCVLLLLLIKTPNAQWVSNFSYESSGDISMSTAKGLAVTTDGYGNCYVAGYCYDALTNNDMLIIKYTEIGDTQWVRTYDGGSNSDDKAYAIVVDAYGYVYVTGTVNTTDKSYQVIVLMYNSEGDLVWQSPFGETDGFREDKGLDIAVSSQSGYVYVTGYTTGADGYSNILVQKYDQTGLVWSRNLDGEEHLDSKGYGIVIDDVDNVYITGYTGSANYSNKIITAKYNADGDLLWQSSYTNPYGGDNQASDLALDENNNVCVTGYAAQENGSYDCILLKYNNSGNLEWLKNYNGNANGEDKAYGIVIDEVDHLIIITGYITTYYNNKDYITISYDYSGNKLWQRNYNGPISGNDKANAIGILHDGRNVVAGESKGYGGDFDFATIKYSKTGSLLQVSRYSMTSSSDDRAKDIAVDNSDVVYVTGASELVVDAANAPSFASTMTVEWDGPDIENQVPPNFELTQNYPNPFNPTTNIDFTIWKAGHIKIRIFDILGQLVQTLVDDDLNIGKYKIVFNGSNLSSGTYFYEMTTGDFRDIKKMILIK